MGFFQALPTYFIGAVRIPIGLITCSKYNVRISFAHHIKAETHQIALLLTIGNIADFRQIVVRIILGFISFTLFVYSCT